MFQTVIKDDDYVQKRNACGKLEIGSYVKVTAAFRALAYGIVFDVVDKDLEMPSTTAYNC